MQDGLRCIALFVLAAEKPVDLKPGNVPHPFFFERRRDVILPQELVHIARVWFHFIDKVRLEVLGPKLAEGYAGFGAA